MQFDRQLDRFLIEQQPKPAPQRRATGNKAMHQGFVAFFNQGAGFGFVTPDSPIDGSRDDDWQ
jgi:hypothetical protein